MNRRYPEEGANGGRERNQSYDVSHGDDRYGARSRGAQPREEETSRWTGEGGSQTYYRRDEEPSRGNAQYGSAQGSNPYSSGQYGGSSYAQGHNPNQFGGQYGSSQGYGGSHGYGGASGYGGQYGSQQGYGGTQFGNSPSQGAYAQQPSNQHGVGAQYGAQPGYGQQYGQQYGAPYAAQQGAPYASQYGQQYGGGASPYGSQDYNQHYDRSTQAYHQQYGSHQTPQYGGAGYPSMQGGAGGPQYGSYNEPSNRQSSSPGYGYQYSGGANYGSGSQYGASGGYGQGNELQARNRGRGPKNYTRSNERLREDICERLSDDPYIDASDIDINVADNGRVTIEGTVTERWMKHRIEDMVDAASGVQQIDNRLTVSGSSSSQYGSSSQSGAQSRSSGSTASGASTTSASSGGTSGSGSPSSEVGKRH